MHCAGCFSHTEMALLLSTQRNGVPGVSVRAKPHTLAQVHRPCSMYQAHRQLHAQHRPAVVLRAAHGNGAGSPATASTPGPAPQPQGQATTPVLLPSTWEVTIDEVTAKYENMDERLDQVERQLLDLTRQLRTGTASVTGGVTSISQGGSIGAGATTSLLSSPVAVQGEAGVCKPGTHHPPAVQLEPGHAHTGSTSRGVVGSSGVTGSKPSSQVLAEGKAAAEATKAAATDAEQHKEASPLNQVISAAKGALRNLAPSQEALDALPAAHASKPHAHGGNGTPAKEATVEVVAEPSEQERLALQEQERAKQVAVERAKARLLQRAAEASQQQATTSAETSNVGAGQQAEGSDAPLLGRDSLYGFNRLQSAITELANSGYIESVKQLRETLLIQEWDMTNRHLAKRRGVAMFERYVAERDLVHEIGGFVVLTALYEDPDALDELLPNDRMKMLARGMIEESLNERRMMLYHSCTQTAKEMASLTSSGISSRMFIPLRQGIMGALLGVLAGAKRFFFPWTRFLPF